jgi:hypothetical protein
MLAKNQSLIIILGIATALLCVPLLAMQFTKEVNWNAADFLIGGVLLYGTGFLVEMALRKFKTNKSRILAVLSILFMLFLIWAELAVGIFGTPFAGN